MSYTIIIVFILTIAFFFNKIHLLKPRRNIRNEYLDLLKTLAEQNMYKNEVPVSAILVFEDKIIGTGRNTMVEENKISAHAELNALNEAFKKFGDDFYNLPKRNFILYTTFEPCPMCQGALLQHGITKICYDEKKNFQENLKLKFRSWLFHLKKTRFKSNNLQKDLFLKHPSFRKHHNLN